MCTQRERQEAVPCTLQRGTCLATSAHSPELTTSLWVLLAMELPTLASSNAFLLKTIYEMTIAKFIDDL